MGLSVIGLLYVINIPQLSFVGKHWKRLAFIGKGKAIFLYGLLINENGKVVTMALGKKRQHQRVDACIINIEKHARSRSSRRHPFHVIIEFLKVYLVDKQLAVLSPRLFFKHLRGMEIPGRDRITSMGGDALVVHSGLFIVLGWNNGHLLDRHGGGRCFFCYFIVGINVGRRTLRHASHREVFDIIQQPIQTGGGRLPQHQVGGNPLRAALELQGAVNNKSVAPPVWGHRMKAWHVN